MRLQRLTGLERDKILDEHAELRAADRALRARSSPTSASCRRSSSTSCARSARSTATSAAREIVDEAAAISVEDLIVDEDMVVTVSHAGYIKRNPRQPLPRAAPRRARARSARRTRDEDFVEHLFVASTHAYILFFTTTGKVYWLKVHEIPQAGRAARGQGDRQPAQPEARGEALGLPARARVPGRPLPRLRHPARARSRRPTSMQYSSPRPSGIIAIALEEGDEVIGVRLTDGTRRGHPVDAPKGRRSASRRRTSGRWAAATYGVRGITLDEGDERRRDRPGRARRDAAHRLRERLRQAHRDRRVPAARTAAARASSP